MTRVIEWWRDLDSSECRFGVCLWGWGGEFYVGRRLYRVNLTRGVVCA